MSTKQVFVTGLTDVRINPPTFPDQLGALRYTIDSVYRYVAFSGANAVAAGDVVQYLTYANDGQMVKVDRAVTGLAAGVAMGVVPAGTLVAPAVAYATGWIRIVGIANLNVAVTGSPSFGSALTGLGAPAGGLIVGIAGQEVCATFYSATNNTIMCSFLGT